MGPIGARPAGPLLLGFPHVIGLAWFGRKVRATARAELVADVMTYEDGGG